MAKRKEGKKVKQLEKKREEEKVKKVGITELTRVIMVLFYMQKE